MTITHVVIDVSDADKERAWEWVLGVRRVWGDHDPYLSAPDHQGEEAKRKIMHQGKIAEVAFAYFTEIPYEHVFTVHEGRGDGKVDFRMILNGIETTVDVKNASRPKGYGLIWPAKKPWEGVADILVYTHLQELGTYRVGGWCYRDEYEEWRVPAYFDPHAWLVHRDKLHDIYDIRAMMQASQEMEL